MDRATRSLKYRALITGVQTVAIPGGTVPVQGVPTTTAAIAAALQAAVDAPARTAAAEAAYHKAVADERAAVAAASTVYLSVKDWALVHYAADPGTLAVFGLAPRAHRQPTVATQAAAVAKSKATRALRHTAGPRQKAALSAQAPATPAAPAAPPTPPGPTAPAK